MDNDDKHITELEIRLAYLEKNQEEQNQVIYEQSKALDTLRKEFTLLEQRLTEARSASDSAPVSDPPPPHY